MSKDSEFNKMTSGGTGWYRIKGEEYRAWLRGDKVFKPKYISPCWDNVNFDNLLPILEMGDYEIAADLLEEAGIGCDEIINQLRGRHLCWVCPESSGYTLVGNAWWICSGCNGTKMMAFPMTPDSWVIDYLEDASEDSRGFKHWRRYIDEDERVRES